jgi:hypothetical protein
MEEMVGLRKKSGRPLAPVLVVALLAATAWAGHVSGASATDADQPSDAAR